MYKNLEEFINLLDKEQELLRVKTRVKPELEIPELIDRQAKEPNGGKAILFENTGTDFPLLTNFLGSDKRISLALGTENLENISKEIEDIFSNIVEPKNTIVDKLKVLPLLSKFASWLPKSKKGKGACQEIVMDSPDLSKLPIMKTWPLDGGKFITFPLVHTLNPTNGIRNLGMYRMQVFSNNTTGMHWHRHKTGANHFSEYKKRGELMPVSVALGGDPVYTYAASAPLPEDIDEYMLAGFLRKKKVELVKCLTNDLEVPADADFVIEGYVDPNEEFVTEGPFGDHTGFYSLADKYPVFHITCITHKKNAVYPATLVGIPPMEDAYMGKATEKIFNFPIRLSIVPELLDLHLPIEGVAHNLTIVQIDKKYPGQALKTANALWGAGQMMFNKIQIIVDKHLEPENYNQLFEYFLNNCDIETDLQFSSGPMDVLDHSSYKFSYGSKLFIDLTKKLPEEEDSYYSNNFTTIEINNSVNSSIKDIKLIKAKKNSIAFIAAKKDKFSTKDEIINLTKKHIKEANIFIILEDTIDLADFSMLGWIIASNSDPMKDYTFAKIENKKVLIIDCLNKSKIIHNFKRDWPNVVIMNDETINLVDKRWEEYQIGEFIESPSKKYSKLFIGENETV
jgi:4-hydroxy-3-polyprenylbenzoate decarboxylase